MAKQVLLLVLTLGLAVAAGAAAAAASSQLRAAAFIAVAHLPRQPEVACASEAVYAAFTVCRVRGASQQCCDKLQAVYGDRSSPAFGCLCLPAALYKTALAASEHNVDALGLLRACRARAAQAAHSHSPDSSSRADPPADPPPATAAAAAAAAAAADPPPPPAAAAAAAADASSLTFNVQWAGHPASCCPPNLQLSSGPVDLLTSFGSEPILSGTWPAWGWVNLQQAGAFLVQYNHTQAFAEHLLGKPLMDLSLQVFLVLPLFYLLAHHAVLRPCSSVYRALPLPARLVVCQHAVYAAVFGASLLPQTLLAARFLFGAWTGDILGQRLWTKLVAFIMSRCGLYLVEGSVRAVKWSWVLVAHHVIFLALLAQNVRSGNPALGVVGVVLDLFAVHEFPLYVALLAYRLRAPTRLARGVLQGALVWYVVTRIAQTAILVDILAGLALLPHINRDPAFIATAGMCAALTVIQAYTVGIYRAIDRKMGKHHHHHHQQQQQQQQQRQQQQQEQEQQQQQLQHRLLSDDAAAADASVHVGKSPGGLAAAAARKSGGCIAAALVAEVFRGARGRRVGAASLTPPARATEVEEEGEDVADCQPHSVGDATPAGKPGGHAQRRKTHQPLLDAVGGLDGNEKEDSRVCDQSPVLKKKSPVLKKSQ